MSGEPTNHLPCLQIPQTDGVICGTANKMALSLPAIHSIPRPPAGEPQEFASLRLTGRPGPEDVLVWVAPLQESDLPAGPGIPQANRVIPTGRHDPATIRSETDTTHHRAEVISSVLVTPPRDRTDLASAIFHDLTRLSFPESHVALVVGA